MIPIVLCIDVEPDLREPEPSAETRWDGWDWFYDRVGALRERLGSLTGRPALLNWFLRIDPQIAALHGDAAYSAKRDRARFAALRAAGDEIGLHPHFWRRADDDRGWFADFADSRWKNGVLDEAVALFRANLGFSPRTHRAGDGLIDDDLVRALVRLGIRYDLTVEPRRSPESFAAQLPGARGIFPDTAAVPPEPYRPARGDYRRPSRLLPRRLWVVPVSMAPQPGGPAGEFMAMNLVMPWRADAFDAFIDGGRAPFMVAVMRAGDLSQGHWRANFEANSEVLFGHPRAREFAFVTPAGLVAWHRARKPDGGGTRNPAV